MKETCRSPQGGGGVYVILKMDWPILLRECLEKRDLFECLIKLVTRLWQACVYRGGGGYHIKMTGVLIIPFRG